MTDGEQEPGTGVKMDEIEAAEKRYDEASPENREAAWLELWHARDFTWQGRTEKAILQTDMVEVPASFPDGREVEGEFKTASLKDYWRWSIGLPGEERLLTDEEMRQAGLLVEVEGETYHLIHAPDMILKVNEDGVPLQILTDIVAARGKSVLEDIGTDENGLPNFARALQLRGSWLPGEVLRYAGNETGVRLSGARISDVNLGGLKLGPLNCVGSLFTGTANFGGATFSGRANFETTTFSGRAYFNKATFSGEASFWKATFSSGTFYMVNFGGWALFNRATFSGEETSFSGSIFAEDVGFEGVTFHGQATFQTASFRGAADFNGATFCGVADFTSVKFSMSAFFFDTRFDNKADFRFVNFESSVSFNNASFNGSAYFDNSSFEDAASFFETIFNDFAGFSRANFRSEAEFKHTLFSGSINFSRASFKEACSFEGTIWSEVALDNAFRNARFYERTDFTSDSFQSVSALNEVRFDIEPIFTNMTGDETNAQFKRTLKATKAAIKADSRKRRDAENHYGILSEDDRWAALSGGYRTLKKIAEQKGDFLLSQTYYRFEVRTRVKRPEIAFWEKIAAAFYGLSSDYGNSIARPFVSLAVILAGFAAIYLALAIEVNLVDWQDREVLQSGFLQSLDFSLNNVFRPLSALSTEPPSEREVSRLAGKLLNNYGDAFGIVVRAISIVQSLTGVVLAFLFGLALRRRFQIS